MHALMLAQLIANCHKRIMEGDYPTTPPFSTEQLEDAVAELDKQNAAMRETVERLTRERDALLAKLPTPEPTNIYYMRDDHTFRRKLPLNLERAVSALREEFDAGATYGMLCGTGALRGTHVHAGAKETWPKFEREARAWLPHAIDAAIAAGASGKPPPEQGR
jgi:hypothetical protein